MKENLQNENIKAILEDNGTLNIVAKHAIYGMQQDDIAWQDQHFIQRTR